MPEPPTPEERNETERTSEHIRRLLLDDETMRRASMTWSGEDIVVDEGNSIPSHVWNETSYDPHSTSYYTISPSTEGLEPSREYFVPNAFSNARPRARLVDPPDFNSASPTIVRAHAVRQMDGSWHFYDNDEGVRVEPCRGVDLFIDAIIETDGTLTNVNMSAAEVTQEVSPLGRTLYRHTTTSARMEDDGSTFFVVRAPGNERTSYRLDAREEVSTTPSTTMFPPLDIFVGSEIGDRDEWSTEEMDRAELLDEIHSAYSREFTQAFNLTGSGCYSWDCESCRDYDTRYVMQQWLLNMDANGGTYEVPSPRSIRREQQRDDCPMCGRHRVLHLNTNVTRYSRRMRPTPAEPLAMCSECAETARTCQCGTWMVPGTECSGCNRTSNYCPQCSRLSITAEYVPSLNTHMCRTCRDQLVQCAECGTLTHNNYMFGESYFCRAHYATQRERMNIRNVTYRNGKGGRRTSQFGTELEVVFPSGDVPFDRGGYHNGYMAPLPFFGGWRSERDGSLPENSAEVISPILNGAGGAAEAIATMYILRDNYDAEITRQCGGHITVGCTDPTSRLQVLRLFTILEEAAFALTGNHRRYTDEHYCAPLKGRTSQYEVIATGGRWNEKYNAAYNKSDAVEFRYPPGTLDATQFTMNLGVCQLVVRLAESLDDSLIDNLIGQTRTSWIGNNSRRIPRWLAFTAYGLTILANQGWRIGGRFMGLPYNPHKPQKVRIVDENRSLTDTIALPTAEDIISLMKENVETFTRAGRTTIYLPAQRAVDGLMSIIDGKPNDTVEEMLNVAAPGGEIVLPEAARLTSRMERLMRKREKQMAERPYQPIRLRGEGRRGVRTSFTIEEPYEDGYIDDEERF